MRKMLLPLALSVALIGCGSKEKPVKKTLVHTIQPNIEYKFRGLDSNQLRDLFASQKWYHFRWHFDNAVVHDYNKDGTEDLITLDPGSNQYGISTNNFIFVDVYTFKKGKLVEVPQKSGPCHLSDRFFHLQDDIWKSYSNDAAVRSVLDNYEREFGKPLLKAFIEKFRVLYKDGSAERLGEFMKHNKKYRTGPAVDLRHSLAGHHDACDRYNRDVDVIRMIEIYDMLD